MITIKEIFKDSIAESIGLKTGDRITTINNFSVRDEIDFKFHSADEKLRIEIIRDNKKKTFRVKKEFSEGLGIGMEEMNMYSCGSDCIFCFITQNPKGLRQSLYFKDGDFRMSFLYGNYITLSNTGPNALKRIIDQRLSPLYVSVHSTDPEVRKYYMKMDKDDNILGKIKLLVQNNIRIHTQIVLSPGINDGESLLKTMSDLYEMKDGIESLAIVPVGLTKHRKNMEKLSRVTGSYAKKLIKIITPLQQKYKEELGINWVYLSDEFYLLAGMALPDEDYYDDYPQIENGVGMCRLFYTQFISQLKKLPKELKSKKTITIATGYLAYPFLMEFIIPHLNKIKNLKVQLFPVKNLLFGSNVTVSGLLSMNCLIKGLEGKKLGDLLVLPANIINHEGIFLDDGKPEDLEKKLKTKILIFNDSWKELFKSL